MTEMMLAALQKERLMLKNLRRLNAVSMNVVPQGLTFICLVWWYFRALEVIKLVVRSRRLMIIQLIYVIKWLEWLEWKK